MQRGGWPFSLPVDVQNYITLDNTLLLKPVTFRTCYFIKFITIRTCLCTINIVTAVNEEKNFALQPFFAYQVKGQRVKECSNLFSTFHYQLVPKPFWTWKFTLLAN